MYQNLHRESAQQLLSELRGQSQPGNREGQAGEFDEPPDLPAPRIEANARLSNNNIQKPERLSFLLKLSVFLSVLSVAGSVAIISWLWWTPIDDTRWRRWVLTSNRLQLSITLAAVIIRTAVGILATLATAMIASVAAEKFGVPLSEVVQISIARYSNTGPLSLGHLALRDSSFKPLLRLILVLLIITTIATQFTSTLLVSDLEQTRIASFPRSAVNSYTFMPRLEYGEATDTGTIYSYWLQRPRSSETFSEYSEQPEVGEGFDDTGPTVRAFLPVTLQRERESLLTFQGMARVFDSQVICMRPKLESLRLCSVKGDADDDSNLCGTVQLDGSVDAVTAGLEWPINEKVNFTCPLTAYRGPPNLYHYVWQICGKLNSLYPKKKWSLANSTMASTTWVIWDGGKAPTRSQWVTDWTMGLLNTTKSGPWTQPTFWFKYLYGKESREDQITFNMTLCSVFNMPNDAIAYLNVSTSASGSSPRSEPSLKWNQDKEVFDTSDVRSQLGAVRNGSLLSHQDRQILSIDRDSLMQTMEEARNGTAWRKYVIHSQGDWIESRLTRHVEGFKPMGLCLFCQVWDKCSPNSNADIVYTRLFMDALAETTSPARAFQALYFMLARNIYYNYATSFTPNSAAPRADFVQSVPVLVPRHFRGYWAVIGTLVIFLATAFATAALFRSTRFSLPENAWHTVAQISNSVEIASVLRNANVATDDEVWRGIMNEDKLTSHTYARVFEGFLGIVKSSIASFTSLFDFHSKRNIPRFVVEEGVFVRALGTGAELELKASESQRRLTSRVAGLESLDSR